MLVMYFTGTGNSKYVAERVAEMAGADIMDVRPLIKSSETIMVDETDVVVATPVYAWRSPKVLTDWMLECDFSKVERIWYVMTCGDQIGGADKYNGEVSRALGCKHMGTAEIIMPENYIAMFNAPFPEEAREIVKGSEERIMVTGQLIAHGKPIPPADELWVFKASSTAVNRLFSKLFIYDKKFIAGEGCTGCGLCAGLCPLNNIEIVDGRPRWLGNCTHCMACICYCPEEAIEYGKGSRGRFRYTFEKIGYDR